MTLTRILHVLQSSVTLEATGRAPICSGDSLVSLCGGLQLLFWLLEWGASPPARWRSPSRLTSGLGRGGQALRNAARTMFTNLQPVKHTARKYWEKKYWPCLITGLWPLLCEYVCLVIFSRGKWFQRYFLNDWSLFVKYTSKLGN